MYAVLWGIPHLFNHLNFVCNKADAKEVKVGLEMIQTRLELSQWICLISPIIHLRLSCCYGKDEFIFQSASRRRFLEMAKMRKE